MGLLVSPLLQGGVPYPHPKQIPLLHTRTPHTNQPAERDPMGGRPDWRSAHGQQQLKNCTMASSSPATDSRGSLGMSTPVPAPHPRESHTCTDSSGGAGTGVPRQQRRSPDSSQWQQPADKCECASGCLLLTLPRSEAAVADSKGGTPGAGDASGAGTAGGSQGNLFCLILRCCTLRCVSVACAKRHILIY